MLVLSRKKNESIMIGDTIEVKVISVDGDTVRLGVEAPRDIQVYRQEIYLSIKEENQMAAKVKVDWMTMKKLLQQPQNTDEE